MEGQQQQGPAPSTRSGHTPPTERDPLLYVVCSACRRSYDSKGPPFYLTTCSHTVCATCTFPSQAPPADLGDAVVECPECRTVGPVLHLVEGAAMDGLAPCFKPLSTQLDEIGMAVRWQMGNVVAQLDASKAKCAEQRSTLGKLGSELKKMQALKNQVAQLSSENAALRAQLAQATRGQPQLGGAPPDLGEQERARSQHSASVDARISNSRKRPGGDSPPRFDNLKQLTSSNSRSSSAMARNFPMQPARLSLTPSHAREHSARQKQVQTTQRSDGVAHGDGRASRSGLAPVDYRSPKNRLADYAYDPSRQAREQQQQEGSLGGEQRRDHTSQPTSSHHDFISPQHQQQHYYQQLEGDIPRFTDPGAASFVPTTALDSSSFRVGDQRHSLAQPSNVRTSFTPTRGITPMPTPNRFGSAQNGAYQYRPTSQQRRPFHPLQPQQAFDPSRALMGTPRPGSSSFTYRDGGGSFGGGGGFQSASSLR